MSDIIIDRNQRFDAIAKLAASANGISIHEQEALLHAIEVQIDRIAGEIALDRETRLAAARTAMATLAKSLKRKRKGIPASKVLRKRRR